MGSGPRWWSQGSDNRVSYQLSTSAQTPSPSIWLCSAVSVFFILWELQDYLPLHGLHFTRGPCTHPSPKEWAMSGLSSAWSSDWPVTDFSYLFRLWGTLGMCPWLCLKRPPAFPPFAQHFLPEQQWLGASGGTRCTVRLPNAGRAC